MICTKYIWPSCIPTKTWSPVLPPSPFIRCKAVGLLGRTNDCVSVDPSRTRRMWSAQANTAVKRRTCWDLNFHCSAQASEKYLIQYLPLLCSTLWYRLWYHYRYTNRWACSRGSDDNCVIRIQSGRYHRRTCEQEKNSMPNFSSQRVGCETVLHAFDGLQ